MTTTGFGFGASAFGTIGGAGFGLGGSGFGATTGWGFGAGLGVSTG
jgi:hypothetical protein